MNLGLKTMEKQVNPEIDTTKFVNIDEKPYDIYIGGKMARHLEANEEQIVPVYVAQVGAKHLVDRILQEQGVKDTLRDTELRKSLFAKILPEMAEERQIKPLSDEDFRKEMTAEMERQKKVVEQLSGKSEESDRIKKLEDELKMLKARLAKKPKVA